MSIVPSFGNVDRVITEFKRNWVRNVQDKSKRWWMEIVLPKEVCIEPTEEMKKVGSNDTEPHILIRITWDNVLKYGKYAVHKVRQYGTYPEDLLRRNMHDVRKAIANALQTLCKSECIWEMVGSDSNVSDVDINVFDDRVDQLKPLIEKYVASWLGGNRLDILFDMNIYLSAFGRKEMSHAKRRKLGKKHLYIQRIPFTDKVNYVFIQANPTPQYQESQLVWALVHLVDETKGSFNEDTIEHYLEKTAWMESWKKAKELNHVLQAQKGNVDKMIVSLVKEAQKQWQAIAELAAEDDATIERYMNTLSTIQYYSRETYLTRGAYFHVVMELSNKIKNLKLQPFEYMHSVIDNLAFIAELCKKNTLCPVQYSAVFAKISKYVYRVCDALIKSGVSLHVGTIRDSAAMLNAMRKRADVEASKLIQQMQQLHELLGVEFRGDEDYTNMDLAAVFEACMHIALDGFTKTNTEMRSHRTSTQPTVISKSTCTNQSKCSRVKKTKRTMKQTVIQTHL